MALRCVKIMLKKSFAMPLTRQFFSKKNKKKVCPGSIPEKSIFFCILYFFFFFPNFFKIAYLAYFDELRKKKIPRNSTAQTGLKT